MGSGSVNGLLPWHAAQWQGLRTRAAQGRLPHALLLTGPFGIGKRTFARLLAQAQFCTAPGEQDGLPCGGCRACLLFQAGTHPDLLELGPPEEGRRIGIDQVRAAGEFLGLTAQYGGAKIVILAPAERLTAEAANSLLKTLEEPPAGALLVLCSAQPAALLPTVRSRCQLIRFPAPAPDVALPWLRARLGQSAADAALLLRLAGGAPLAAVQLAESEGLAGRADMLDDLAGLAAGKREPTAVAAAWLKHGPDRSLYWVHSWVADMIRLRMLEGEETLLNPDMAGALQALGERVDLHTLFEFLERSAEAMRLATGQINPQLLLEQLMVFWTARNARG